MPEKKYKVVTYMRIDPEEGEGEPMTLAEANAEVENLELMCPEDKHAIELWDGDE